MNYNCNCKKFIFSDKNYSYWENRKTTSDEMEILQMLLLENDLKNKEILHIGIGNSDFAKNFYLNNKITGISISKSEINYGESLNNKNYKVFFCDKYSLDFANICKQNNFDFIIDTNLKSYSCCLKTFEFMIHNIFKSIKPKGMLITSVNGMKWFKDLKPKLSFSFRKFFFYKLKEINGNKHNILLPDELGNLSKKYNIKMSIDDKLCYLKK